MHSIYQILFFIYFVGFALLACLPGWRSLLVGATLALLLCIWAVNEVLRIDSPGVAIALPVVALGCLGLFAGAAARAAILVSRSIQWRMSPYAILAMAFIGIPPGVMGLSEARSWFMYAPPSAACSAKLHRATIGDVMLALPLAPVISVGEGQEFNPRYAFWQNRQARAFCWRASRPIALTNLNVDFVENSGRGRAAFCAKEQPFAWWAAACSQGRSKARSDYPERITVYVLGEYNAGRMIAHSANDWSIYGRELAGLTPIALPDGAQEYVRDRYHYFTLPRPDGYVARCWKSSRGATPDEFYCNTGFPLTSRLGVAYNFRSSRLEFAEHAMRVDEKVRMVFDSLKRR